MEAAFPPLSAFKDIPSPALVFLSERIDSNIQELIRMVGGNTRRLRLHCKTHKCSEIAKRVVRAGIDQHKCATLVEALMLARAGAKDILLSYPLIGPNPGIFAKLCKAFGDTRFSFLVDNVDAIEPARLAFENNLKEGLPNPAIWLDIDVGMGRTGIGVSGTGQENPFQKVGDLAKAVVKAGFPLRGLHLYDGQVNMPSLADRKVAGHQVRENGQKLRTFLEKTSGNPLEVVVGGSPSFMAHAFLGWEDAVFSPGTLVLHDCGYGGNYPDMAGFHPAALLFARVISKPFPGRITLDLGYKAVSADPPMNKRASFPDLPGARIVMQSEEHLVLEGPGVENLELGQGVWAIPYHVCPTIALHDYAIIWEIGQLTKYWEIDARTRYAPWDQLP